MPHLRYAGRLWHIAADDLSVPALCSLAGRLMWTALISAVFAVAENRLSNCAGSGWVYVTYLSLSIALFAGTAVIDVLLMGESLKGSIVQDSTTRNVDRFLTAKLLAVSAQIVLAVFGVITLIVGAAIPCGEALTEQQLTHAFVAIVAASQLTDAGCLFCCCVCLRASDVPSALGGEERREEALDEAWTADIWAARCRKITRMGRFLFCGVFGGASVENEGGLEAVAKVLTLFFHHDGFLDVVPSDVVAGITLVRIEQRAARYAAVAAAAAREYYLYGSANSTISRTSLDNSQSVDLDGIDVSITQHEGTLNVVNPGSIHQTHNMSNSVVDVDIEAAYGPVSAYVASYSTTPPTVLENGQLLSPKSNSHEAFTPSEVDDWLRCSVFSLAMYTHLMVMYMHPCTGACTLLTNSCMQQCNRFSGEKGYNSILSMESPDNSSRCFGCGRCCGMGSNGSVSIEGDNCCRFHNAGLTIFTRHLVDTDLIFVSYKNDNSHKPFAVFLDHSKKWVVISIRGTLSLEDCITDALCEPIEMTEAGKRWGFDGRGIWAHAGMLVAAEKIRTELDRLGLLQRIYGTSGSLLNPGVPSIEPSSHANYRLVITGHSLGAGAAILLAMLLRPQHPNLKCIALGTPAAVLDAESSRRCASYCTSLALGNDLVCRLNFGALCALRNEVLSTIGRAKVNKLTIMRSVFREDVASPDDFLYRRGEEPQSEFTMAVDRFRETIDKRCKTTYEGRELCIPGRIIHFRKVKTGSAAGSLGGVFAGSFLNSCFSREIPHYVPSVRPLEAFKEISVSPTMVGDHLPDRYYDEIKRIGDFLSTGSFAV